jgi:phage terminase large subunit
VNTVNGSDFLFKGLRRNEQSVKSIEGIDIAWVEEAQTVSESSIEILTPTVRKKGSQIIYTYNRLLEEDPVHKRLVIEGRPNTLVINLNYDVAIKYGWLPDVIREEMESDKLNRPSLYKYKWLGEPSSKEAKIYKGWLKTEDIPHEARLSSIGLDFGYTNDPTAIIAIYYYNGGYILDEIAFRKGLSNKQIADIINLYLSNRQENVLTIADSAEPKSIDEIRMYGVSIIGATKGAGSVNQGIQFVQSQKISVTEKSLNLWEAYQNYLWEVDKDGKLLNTPNHMFSDALDAVRYGFNSVTTAKRSYDYEEATPLYSDIGL